MTGVTVDDGRRDGVRLVTFDRPDARNAFDAAMYDGLRQVLSDSLADDAIRVVVLTGAGSAFCAGQDLAELVAIAEGRAAGTSGGNGFQEVLDLLTGFDKPLLAAVNGAAVGFGATLLPHCDVVLAGERARFKLPFAEFGVPPEAAGSLLLPARMGWQRAALMLFTGDWLSAADAVEAGLVLRCVPDGELLDTALDLAGRIAGATTPALRGIKRAMLASRAPAVRAALAAEHAAYATELGAQTAESIRLAGAR